MSIRSLMLENVDETIVPGKIVWNNIISLTPNEDDVPTYFGIKFVKPRNFKYINNFQIKTLLETDPDFKEYYDSGTDRYENNEDIDADDIYNEITVVDGMLIDGYNRCSVLLRSGVEKTNAFVAI